MYWLALETSSGGVSLAVGEDARCLREVAQEGNASRLVEPLYRQLDVNLSQVQRCVISQGPGSYNGLRVGYAFLKGLLVPGPVPVTQVPTPLVLAARAAEQLALKEGRLLVLNNARRGEIYGALVVFQGGRFEKIEEAVTTEAEFARRLTSRPDAVVSADLHEGDLPALRGPPWVHAQPSAALAGRIAFQQDLPATAHLSEIEPFYVREPVPGFGESKKRKPGR